MNVGGRSHGPAMASIYISTFANDIETPSFFKKKKNVSSPRGANCLLSQAATPRWSEKDTFVKKMCDHYQSVVLSSLLFDDIIIIKSSQHCIPRCRALTLHQK